MGICPACIALDDRRRRMRGAERGIVLEQLQPGALRVGHVVAGPEDCAGEPHSVPGQIDFGLLRLLEAYDSFAPSGDA
jgi:hypothetical protein